MWGPYVACGLAIWFGGNAFLSIPLNWLDVFIAVVGFGSLFVGALEPRLQAFARAVIRGSDGGGALSLTFDDGPDPVTTTVVLDLLRQHQMKATFFVVGHKAEAHPELVKRIHADGHEIGNHSYHHRWFPFMSVSAGRREIRSTQQTIESIIGRRPRLFRPPYGLVFPAIGRALSDEALTLAGWSIRSGDTWLSFNGCLARIRRKVKAGEVILLHDSAERAGGAQPHGPEILVPLLRELELKGLKSVTFSELTLSQ